ncbi:hypothetical protein HN51_007582 [Arachis hypogaea]|uniref:Bifunctional inhibitor/plant lipid transfer protein/seed storage helical domain-containing protein n=2 Tax=Arachis TaxID=3817 RepID=A0A445D721_ARAHY|nr:non-specific lipid transfer protein GPI-anchored 2 isoform X2 [Arachis hypogaea]RYR59077.1 hypothetical protein Ahy_A05g024917 [Arachis hypogaea]
MPTMATGVTAAFVLLLALVAHTEAPTSPTATGGCTDELLSFSACLSYVSSPPNDLNERPSANCCAAFNSAAESGGAICLCYFVRYPNILGFPINSTRLISLSSICNPTPPLSLNFLCSASPALPPLNSAATLGFTISGIQGGGGGSSTAPKIGGRSPKSGGRGRPFFFPLSSNGNGAASTHLCSSNTLLLLSVALAIFVSLLNTQ